MNKRQIERAESLLPTIDGKKTPKKIRIYDNGGKTIDRYTAVFTGNYKGRNGICHYIGFSVPQQFWIHDDDSNIIDYPKYGHLGKKIKFADLPEESQRALKDEYCDIWEIPHELR